MYNTYIYVHKIYFLKYNAILCQAVAAVVPQLSLQKSFNYLIVLNAKKKKKSNVFIFFFFSFKSKYAVSRTLYILPFSFEKLCVKYDSKVQLHSLYIFLHTET